MCCAGWELVHVGLFNDAEFINVGDPLNAVTSVDQTENESRNAAGQQNHDREPEENVHHTPSRNSQAIPLRQIASRPITATLVIVWNVQLGARIDETVKTTLSVVANRMSRRSARRLEAGAGLRFLFWCITYPFSCDLETGHG